ncbi:phage integrase central domain-containing protein [Caballeronia sp. LZ001]|uniref:tyrosine-type recombinase/integrase n=1 Tax=Caballeronia sp. LZ001 TaxID=3038553 RepID=UPI00286B8092|nr:integrase arm-type DNA-binding domain-containing protein [Caballeronia sp. LZ001]
MLGWMLERNVGRTKMPKIAKELGALAVSRLTEPGFYSVGKVAGLALNVSPTGSRSWILRAMVGGKRRDIGLGAYPAVSLKDAHEKAQAKKDEIVSGIDPVLARKEAASRLRAAQAVEVTFEEAAKRYMNAKAAGWKNAKHRDQWKNTLAEYAYPVIGKMLVRHIHKEHVFQVLEPIWTTKTETASRLRGRIANVLDWAKASGFREGDNPAEWRGNLKHRLSAPSETKGGRNQPALPFERAAEFMIALKDMSGSAARCLEFAILTATRSGEARGATWTEINLKDRVWTIPEGRMKAKKEHRVPLSPAAIELLNAMPRFDDCDLVFPSPTLKLLSDMTLLAVIKRMNGVAKIKPGHEAPKPVWFDPKNGDAVVPHGFRSTFRDWVADLTAYPNHVAEMALAHTIGDAVEKSYRRGDLFDKRRHMMDAWAEFLSKPYSEGVVIPIQRSA